MSAPALRRERRSFAEREVSWLDAHAGERAWHLLRYVDEVSAGDGREHVVALVGDELRTLDSCRRWLGTKAGDAGELPEGWRGDGHYLRPPAPIFRFRHDDGRRLTVLRAAAWWGEGDYTADDAALAWGRLSELVAGNFDEGRVLLTPATTGRYLLLRSITFGRSWPTLDDELQELIRSTSGQGRIQHFDHGAGDELVDLVAYDARLAYAACATELGAGAPVRDRVDDYAGQQRGRYLVDVTVPRDWSRACSCGAPGHPGIGLLPNASNTGAWEYPANPGATFATWCDGAELRVALDHGWRVTIRERLLFPWPPYPALTRRSGQPTKRGPLDVWAPRLAALRAAAAAGDPMVASALRAIVLTGIGAMHGRGHRTTHVVGIDDAGELPADVDDVERVDDWLVYTEGERDAAKWAAMSHPEWSAAIWGRARARLLDAPGAERVRTGALHVPASTVLAFRTDAIWLVGHDPEWRDDGRVGRYRRAAVLPRVELPRSARQLDQIRKARKP